MARTAEERRRIVSACRRSGLSTREFAEHAGIPASTLYQWLAAARPAPVVRLARVVRRPAASESSTAAVLLLELAGARLHVPSGFDRATLSTVLELIASRRSEAL